MYLILLLTSIVGLQSSAYAENKRVLEKGLLLVATEQMNDTGYEKAVIYITETNAGGVFGLIINKPTRFSMSKVLPEMSKKVKKKTLYFGGPMHMQYLFVLADAKDTNGLHPIKNGVSFGTGKETIEKLTTKNIGHLRTFAGFASWGPEQLEEEISQGAWLLVPAENNVMFDEHPEAMWQNLYDKWSGSWI